MSERIFIAGKGVVTVTGVTNRLIRDPVTGADMATEGETISVEVESDEIVVSPFGVVAYLLDGKRHVGYNLPVRIDEAEELPLAPPQPAGPECERCGGSTAMVKTWNPPVCPKCGRK